MHEARTRHAARISGLWLPLITPFHDGAVDLDSFAALVEHYAALPVDGLIVGATTGEGLTLTDDELAALAAAARRATRRVPVYLGLAGSATARMVKALAATAPWPIDGYLISCPYYTRPSQDGLYRHFAALAAATPRPIVLYNIPYRTGVNLANATLHRLAELPNIVGVKDCCADLAQSFDLMRHRRVGFGVMTGEDAQLYLALSQGADGGILASAHVETRAFAAVLRAMASGDAVAARSTWDGLIDTVRLLFTEPSPAPIKHWLWREGLIRSPELRLPMTGVSAALAAAIARKARGHALSG